MPALLKDQYTILFLSWASADGKIAGEGSGALPEYVRFLILHGIYAELNSRW